MSARDGKGDRVIAIRHLQAFAIAGLAAGTAPVQGGLVAKWTFDDRRVQASAGEGEATPLGTRIAGWRKGDSGRRNDRAMVMDGFDASGGPFFGSAEGVGFTLCTCGWTDLRLTWSQRIDRRASSWARFEYLGADGFYTTAGLQDDGALRIRRVGRFVRLAIDLAGIEAATDNEAFRFRIVAMRDPRFARYESASRLPYDPAGTWALDSVTAIGNPFRGNHVPGPGPLGLLALAGGAWHAGRRRRS